MGADTWKIQMVPNSIEARGEDARNARRESLYLGATLYCDGSSTPVRIRNLSATGALLEAAAIPDCAAVVQLVRGELIIHGLVVWRSENRIGFKFCGSVDVQQWRATPTNSEQRRVDDVVRLVKAGAVPLPLAHAGAPGRSDGAIEDQPGRVQDLQRALDLLDRLGDSLAGDPEVVTRHGSALQMLDIAMQVIAAVAGDSATCERTVADSDKMDGLRRSADQALLRVA